MLDEKDRLSVSQMPLRARFGIFTLCRPFVWKIKLNFVFLPPRHYLVDVEQKVVQDDQEPHIFLRGAEQKKKEESSAKMSKLDSSGFC